MQNFSLTRRHALLGAMALSACGGKVEPSAASKKRLCVTMDDFNLDYDIRLNPRERNERILEALTAYNHQAIGFVTGRFVNGPFGDEIVQSWVDNGHIIGNHTYSHENSTETEADIVKADILRNDVFLSKYASFEKLFRFPYLAEGGRMEKVQSYREFLKSQGYQNVSVTIDSIDWYTSSRMEDRLRDKSDADLGGYRNYYIKAVVDIANFRHALANRLGFTDLPHMLLVHHNILNGLFLRDVMDALVEDGWEFVDASDAIAHPLYELQPMIPTHSRSILSVLAQERGLDAPGYPAAYQGFGEKTMDALGL